MRSGIGLISLVALGLVLGIAFSQEAAPETKTVAPKRDPVLRPPLDPSRIWSFHFEGKKANGAFLELARPDEQNEGKGRTLVITLLEVRQRQTMRWQFVEHKKAPRSWKKSVRRSELFSLGQLDESTKYLANLYRSNIGMRFDPDMRPSIEVTQGSGNMAVYAEGYWAD
ncbi:MAG: hypothetical protein AAGD14_17940 [Planctomycetota bacterium]